jgi:hypothetical protein
MTLLPLATVADVELVFGPIDDEERAKVARLLDWASAGVRRWCRQALSRVDEDEVVVPSSGTSLIVLAERPVVEVHDVVVERGPGFWTAETGRFTWDPAGNLRRLDGRPWGRRFDPVVVTYSHGYDPVPDELVGLVAAKVAGALAGTHANPDGLKSLQTGAMSETYSNNLGTATALGAAVLTEEEKTALSDLGYRRRAMAVPIGAQ